jgi:hypothetical protein
MMGTTIKTPIEEYADRVLEDSRDVDFDLELSRLKSLVESMTYKPPEGWYPIQKEIAKVLNKIALFTGLRLPKNLPNVAVPLDDAEVEAVKSRVEVEAAARGEAASVFQMLKDVAVAQVAKIAALLPEVPRDQ